MTTTGLAAAPAETILDVRGHRVCLVHAGAGAPLLYLHGEDDPGGWEPVLGLLARDFTVLRPDHPGFNRSDDDPAVDSVLDMAFSYLDLLDQLGLDRVSLAGVSLGGWLAAQIAVLAGDRVTALVLAGAAGVRADVPTPDIFTLSPAEVAELTYHRPDLRAAAVAQAAKIQDDPERFQRYLRNRMACAHLGWNPYLHDPKLPGRLHRIAARVLVIWGAEDRLLPAGYAHRWVAALPAARLQTIDDAGHLPSAEQPAVFAAMVAEFLTAEGSS
jgi:pimeloyl-ACP methyl ester carboxylesterase